MPKKKPGPKEQEGPKKTPHSTYLSPEAEIWIDEQVPRSISKSRFISAAVDHFISSPAARKFIDAAKKKLV